MSERVRMSAVVEEGAGVQYCMVYSKRWGYKVRTPTLARARAGGGNSWPSSLDVTSQKHFLGFHTGRPPAIQPIQAGRVDTVLY
jgi:hypothetical protein